MQRSAFTASRCGVTPANPRTFEPSNLRTFEPSNLRTLEPSNPRTLEPLTLPFVSRFSRQAGIVDGHSHRKVIEALPIGRRTVSARRFGRAQRQSEQLVHSVIEVTSDTGASCASGFGFQIEHLPYQAGLPEEA